MTSLAIDLPFTKRTLANGLDVIVHEDHHVPIVAVTRGWQGLTLITPEMLGQPVHQLR